MYDFVDETFNRNSSHENKLSIQVSLNGFSFCILEENKVLVFKCSDFIISSAHLMTRRFSDWYNEEEFLQLPFKKREIVINSRNFALIPEQLESENLKKTISELLPGGSEAEYAEGWIKSLKAKLVYHLPPEFVKTVTATLGESRLLHPVQKLAGFLKRTTDKNNVLLYFDDKDMYFVLKKNNDLVLANIYRINHANDAAYFILSVMQQFGLPAKNISVLIGGKTALLKELQLVLSHYFSDIETIIPQYVANPVLTTKILSENICLF